MSNHLQRIWFGLLLIVIGWGIGLMGIACYSATMSISGIVLLMFGLAVFSMGLINQIGKLFTRRYPES